MLEVYSKVDSIRIVPMSRKDISFIEKSISEVQEEYFLGYLPKSRYLYRKSINNNSNTLVLFQFHSKIIAMAILIDNLKFSQADLNGYKGAYYFDPSSICILENPLEDYEIKNIWNNFSGFSQVMHDLDIRLVKEFLNKVQTKKKRFVS